MRNKTITHRMIVSFLLFSLYCLSACSNRAKVFHITVSTDSTGGSLHETTNEMNTPVAADTITTNISAPSANTGSLRLDSSGGGTAKCTYQLKVWSTFEEASKRSQQPIKKP